MMRPYLATLLVQASIIVLALTAPSAGEAALTGLAATLFLLAVHLRASPALAGTALRTLLPIAAATAVAALLATLLPSGVRWLPAVAPVGAVLLYASVVAPYARRPRPFGQ